MLHMICGKTLRDGISNQTIRDMHGEDREVHERVEFKMAWAHGKDR